LLSNGLLYVLNYGSLDQLSLSAGRLGNFDPRRRKGSRRALERLVAFKRYFCIIL